MAATAAAAAVAAMLLFRKKKQPSPLSASMKKQGSGGNKNTALASALFEQNAPTNEGVGTATAALKATQPATDGEINREEAQASGSIPGLQKQQQQAAVNVSKLLAHNSKASQEAMLAYQRMRRRRMIISAVIFGVAVALLIWVWLQQKALRERARVAYEEKQKQKQLENGGSADDQEEEQPAQRQRQQKPQLQKKRSLKDMALSFFGKKRQDKDVDGGYKAVQDTPGEMLELAKQVREAGLKIYGVTQCGWTKRQRDLFGERGSESRAIIESIYTECRGPGSCPSGITGFPTWGFGDSNDIKLVPGFRDSDGVRDLLNRAQDYNASKRQQQRQQQRHLAEAAPEEEEYSEEDSYQDEEEDEEVEAQEVQALHPLKIARTTITLQEADGTILDQQTIDNEGRSGYTHKLKQHPRRRQLIPARTKTGVIRRSPVLERLDSDVEEEEDFEVKEEQPPAPPPRRTRLQRTVSLARPDDPVAVQTAKLEQAETAEEAELAAVKTFEVDDPQDQDGENGATPNTQAPEDEKVADMADPTPQTESTPKPDADQKEAAASPSVAPPTKKKQQTKKSKAAKDPLDTPFVLDF